MQKRDEILFPIEASKKHPHTREVIEIAEEAGMSLTDIANLIGCSQSYISQLKSGKVKSKVQITDLEPLIHKLSSKAPGDSFNIYTVFNKAIPRIPDNWEEQILLTGLIQASEKTDSGRYPSGQDGIEFVENSHFEVLATLNDEGGAYRSMDDYVNPFAFSKRAESSSENLKEALDTYLIEKKAIQHCRKANEEYLQDWVKETVDKLNYKNRFSPEPMAIEDQLIEALLTRLDEKELSLPSPGSWAKNHLVNACQSAKHALHMSPLIINHLEGDLLEQVDTDEVQEPEEHARRLLENVELIKQKLDDKKREKEHKFRLRDRYNKKAFKSLLNLQVINANDMPMWKDHGRELFGNLTIKVHRSSDLSYEINLTDAFTQWAQQLCYKVEEEIIQVCGSILLSKEIGESKLIIHELYTKQFIVLHTFKSQTLDREVTVLSGRLSVVELFTQIENNSQEFDWQSGKDDLIFDLKNALLERGFRIPGIRSIY